MTTQLRELPPVTCPKYDPLPGTKRCRHYLPNGACALADEFMCVEWMKVNGPAQAPVATPSPAPFTLDLFGAPMVHAPPGALPPAAPAPPASSAPAVVGALSQLDVASFKARGLEVLLATSQLGDVWLVTEQATDFPARVSGNCVHCDHRAQCSAYTEALRGKRTILGADPDDLDAVAREREEVSKLAKIFYARKSELEGVLRQHLRDRDDLVLAGMRYSLVPTTAGISYPAGRTLRVLEDRTGLPRDELLERVATIDRDALDALVSETVKTADKARATLLRAEVNALADHFTVPVWAPTNGLSPPCAAQRPRIDRWVTEHQGRHECACGCGTQISIVARHHCVGIPRYAPNHSPRPKLGLGPAHPRYISDRTLAVRPRAFPAYVKRAVMVEFQGRCAWCGTADSLECDHIIPASLGGEATLANAQLLCANCHRWKTAIEPTSRSGKTPETRSRKRREGVPHAGDR